MQIIEDYVLSLLENSSKQKPVKRSEIQEKTHMSAKKVEQAIGELRDKGHFICGVSSQGGYYLPRTEQERKEFLREYTARAFTTLRRAARMQGIEIGQTKLQKLFTVLLTSMDCFDTI